MLDSQRVSSPPKAAEFYVVRHGQDEDNAAGILNGRRNRPLTALGESQIAHLSAFLASLGVSFSKVYASPLSRAFRTGEGVALALGLPPPDVLDDLIERDMGAMSGRLIRDIPALCKPDILVTSVVTYFLAAPGSETFPDLLVRAKRTLRQLNERHEAGAYILACHGDIGKMLYAAFYDIPWEVALGQFHLGNSDAIRLSRLIDPTQAHIFHQRQHNH